MNMFKNMLKFKKSYLETLFFLIISLFWIAIFIYFRFIKKQVGYDLQTIKNNYSDIFLLINILFILLHIILILYALYKIFIKIKENHITIKFIKYLQNIGNILFIKPFVTLRELIAPHIPYSGLFFCKITEKIDLILKDEKRSLSLLKIPVILFSFVPRIIVANIFFIEIIFYKKLHYFIPSLLLLLIPLIWNIFVNLYTRFAEQGLIDVPKYIKIIPIGESTNGWYSSYKFEPLPQFTYEPGEVQEYGDTYIICIKMYAFGAGLNSFKQYQSLLLPYSTLITSSLYLSAGLYRLIYILF